jgi:hypothetical protein
MQRLNLGFTATRAALLVMAAVAVVAGAIGGAVGAMIYHLWH